jgi:hypothetical protein
MIGKCPGCFLLVFFISIQILAVFDVHSADAYQVCTFKGTVVGNGWRTMIVRSNGQCATVNVGWRTRYIPNRRPCLGERVAVDFSLEQGFMKAIKVVSLTPTPVAANCYPPAPPRTSACRDVLDDRAIGECPSQDGSCSRTPPPHVRGRVIAPPTPKKPLTTKPPKPAQPQAKKPGDDKKPDVTLNTDTDEKERDHSTTPTPPDPKDLKTMTGEVVASSPRSLSIRVTGQDEAVEVQAVRVGLTTKFIPFRRPAVGEKVEVKYAPDNGGMFGHVVQVIQ